MFIRQEPPVLGGASGAVGVCPHTLAIRVTKKSDYISTIFILYNMPLKYNSFGITLQPYGGLTPEILKKIETHILPKCEYYLVITEPSQRGGEHLHAALYLDRKVELKYFNAKIMKRHFCKLLDERSVWKVAYKGKNLYNDDWVSNYLTKDDSRTVLHQKLPTLDVRQEYYADVERKTSVVADYYYAKLEILFEEWAKKNATGLAKLPREATFKNVCKFMHSAMYEDRTIRVVACPRKLEQIASALLCYVTKGKAQNDLFVERIVHTNINRRQTFATEVHLSDDRIYTEDMKRLASMVVEHEFRAREMIKENDSWTYR